ncbi:hypothetical protein JCM9279_005011 [Rhodotorula babjevae]
MDRLPMELLSHILRVDEDPTASYTSTAFKARQAELRKLCSVSRCMRRVARPLLWRVVVVETEREASSLNNILAQPGSSELGEYTTALAAVQRIPAPEPDGEVKPDLLVATTVFRLVLKLRLLEQLYLVGFGPFKMNSATVFGKVGLDFSSSGPLRTLTLTERAELRRLVVSCCTPYLKRVFTPAAHALVELALPTVLEASFEDVSQVLSTSILPNLRRLRLGMVFTRDDAHYLIETGPSPAFIAQLDFLHLVDQPLMLWDGATGHPPGYPYLGTDTPVLIEVSADHLVSYKASPALPLVRHLYVREASDWWLVADVLSGASSLDVLYVHESFYYSLEEHEWDQVVQDCTAEGLLVALVVEDELAVILPEFIEHCSPEQTFQGKDEPEEEDED